MKRLMTKLLKLQYIADELQRRSVEDLSDEELLKIIADDLGVSYETLKGCSDEELPAVIGGNNPRGSTEG
jgi:hypothetical protein